MQFNDYECRSHGHADVCRWETQTNHNPINQQGVYDYGAHTSDYSQNFNEISHSSTISTYPVFERRDSGCFHSSKPIETATSYSFPILERKETLSSVSYSGGKSADQFAFTEFDLPSNIDALNNMGGRTASFDRRASLSSNNLPVSLPESSVHYDSCNVNQLPSINDKHYSSDSSSSVSSKSTVAVSKESSSCPDDYLEEGAFRMTRVDWRWAALKGFWDKDKKCWIESAGGQAAYIQQRMQRVQVRKQRLARQAKAMQRLVPVQNLPFRSGLVEELPYQLDSDPWTEALGNQTVTSSSTVSKASAPSWFDKGADHDRTTSSSAGVSVQVFPFSRTCAEPMRSMDSSVTQRHQQAAEALSCGTAPKWFEAVYANPTPALSVPQCAWSTLDESNYRPNQFNTGAVQQSDMAPLRPAAWW